MTDVVEGTAETLSMNSTANLDRLDVRREQPMMNKRYFPVETRRRAHILHLESDRDFGR